MTTLLILEIAFFPFTLLVSIVLGAVSCLLWYVSMVIYEEFKYGKN